VAEKLTGMERDVLDMLANNRSTWSDTGKPIIWGAALSEIVEGLHARKLVTYPSVKITHAGRLALEKTDDR